MEQSPSWEANRFSANQKVPCIVWYPKVHSRIHKCPPPVRILSQIDPVHNLTSNFLKIHLNIILLSAPGSSKWSLPLMFPTKTLYTPLLTPICATCPTHLILVDFISSRNIRWAVQIIKLSLCSFLHSPVTKTEIKFIFFKKNSFLCKELNKTGIGWRKEPASWISFISTEPCNRNRTFSEFTPFQVKNIHT